MNFKFLFFTLILIISVNKSLAQTSVRDSLRQFSINVAKDAMRKGKINKIAVWDFTDMNKEISVFGSYISELFSIYAEDIDSLELMDRQNLKSLLREHKLKSEGFIDKNTIMQLGKFAEVDAVVVGSVIMVDKNFQVLVKIIGTSSGKTMSAKEQLFEIDKNMAAILGIDYEGTNNLSTSNNNPNRGFNRPLNSNEQLNNSSTVSKECEKNNSGDFCFYNATKHTLIVYFCNSKIQCVPSNLGHDGGIDSAEYFIIKPKESKCFYELSTKDTFTYKAFSKSDYPNISDLIYSINPIMPLDQGTIRIEKCKSKTYSIK